MPRCAIKDAISAIRRARPTVSRATDGQNWESCDAPTSPTCPLQYARESHSYEPPRKSVEHDLYRSCTRTSHPSRRDASGGPTRDVSPSPGTCRRLVRVRGCDRHSVLSRWPIPLVVQHSRSPGTQIVLVERSLARECVDGSLWIVVVISNRVQLGLRLSYASTLGLLKQTLTSGSPGGVAQRGM